MEKAAGTHRKGTEGGASKKRRGEGRRGQEEGFGVRSVQPFGRPGMFLARRLGKTQSRLHRPEMEGSGKAARGCNRPSKSPEG